VNKLRKASECSSQLKSDHRARKISFFGVIRRNESNQLSPRRI